MIASFLFGNIDEEGKLESTYLNEVKIKIGASAFYSKIKLLDT